MSVLSGGKEDTKRTHLSKTVFCLAAEKVLLKQVLVLKVC